MKLSGHNVTCSSLSWDDVTLMPRYSEIRSRSQPNTTVEFLGREIATPIMSANMDTISGAEMCIKMAELGGIGVLHRFNTTDENMLEYRTVRAAGKDCYVTIGTQDWSERAAALYDAGARVFVVDIAHGHSVLMREVLTGLREEYESHISIIAGNVAVPEAVADLHAWGADAVKVGVGGGSICKTRVVTGHGVPMFSSVNWCAGVGVPIIADGGIKSSGDIVKALAAGASMVMIGSLFSGTKEAPGDVMVDEHGRKTKVYRGMASFEAQADRDYGKLPTVAAEGVSSVVPYKGSVKAIFDELKMGLKSGMSYCNAMKISEIPQKAVWLTQTHSGYIEGTPHILRRG